MGTLTCPACAAEVKPGDLICFTCGANLPRTRPDDEDAPAPATIMQEYLKRDETTGSISLTVLRIASRPATSRCRRAPRCCWAGIRRVAGRRRLLRLRERVPAARDGHGGRPGHATIRDENSTNGTFVNGDRVLPGTTVRLADGDMVRLAADVTGEVLLPRQEADPASLSRPDLP